MDPDQYYAPCRRCGAPKPDYLQCRRCGWSPPRAETLRGLALFLLCYGAVIQVLFWLSGVGSAFLLSAAVALAVWAGVQFFEWARYAKAVPHDPVPLSRRLKNLWLKYRPRLRRALTPLPRPDFLDAEIILVTVRPTGLYSDGSQRREPERRMAWFPAYPPDLAQRHGWVANVFEYEFLADLTFAYRFPSHPFSVGVRQEWPDIPDGQIPKLARGEIVLAS